MAKLVLVAVLSAEALWGDTSLVRVPLSFEPGVGNSEFIARAGGMSVHLRPTMAMIGQGRMRLIGASGSAAAQPEGLLAGYTNYLMGSDPRRWRTHVPNYRRVRYHNVYPGIDVVYYGNPRELEFDFIVAPGADPRRIQLAMSDPDLQIRVPRVYQDDHAVKGRAVRHGNRITFGLAAYDRSRPLIIDPVLSYAALFGGGSLEEGRAIAVDSSGATYVIGNTTSSNFPVINGQAGRYSFLAKINPAGDALLYSTYLPWAGGGPSSYAIDASGNAYITRDGEPDFPLIGPAPLRQCGRFPPDVYIARLSADGASLVYSGCIGGSAPDYPAAIAVDAAGNAYVTGVTQSADFPLVNALQATHPEGNGFIEGFVLKLRPDGAVTYSTFLGGGSGDMPRAIAADAGGNAYITGQTRSLDFPLKNAVQKLRQESPNGSAFVAKINPSGSDLVYSTYLGGSGGDSGLAIAADALGNTYVAGSTVSADFPITADALQARFSSVFLFKTTDAAANWTRSDSGLPGSPSFVLVDPGNPSRIYAIGGPGRLFKSSDRGGTWQATSAATASVLWINPADSTLYVGTPKGDLLKSSDAGLSFTSLQTGVPGHLNQMIFNPQDPAVIYGRWGGSGPGDGIYKSADGGETWKPTGFTGSATGRGGLAIDPARPSTLYASSNQRGLVQSIDAGETWTTLDPTLVTFELLVDSASKLYAVSRGVIRVRSGDGFVSKIAPGSVVALAIDRTNSAIWYVVSYESAFSTVYKSTDSGENWKPVNSGLPNLHQITSLAVDPISPDTLYIGLGSLSDGFFAELSPDGSSLQYATYFGGSSNDSVKAIAVDASGNTYLAGDTDSSDIPMKAAFRAGGGGFIAKFDANNALVWSSSLGGGTPSAITLGPAGDLYLTGSSSSPEFPTPGAIQGLVRGGFFRTTDGGTSWTGSTLASSVGSVTAMALDPHNASRVFALGDHLYSSNDGGQSWMQLGTPAPASSNSLIVDPQNAAIMYMASSIYGLLKSTDGGVTWVEKPVIAGTTLVPLLSLAIDPKTPATLYGAFLPPANVLPPGAASGLRIFKSIDAGTTWNLTSSPTYPTAVVVDPLNPSVVYASFAFSSPVPGPTGIVARSSDGGATWTTLTNVLSWIARVLVVDPATPGRIYALGSFTSGGVYRSDDAGSNWMTIGSGLPGSQVTALAIDPTNPSLLYAASEAGGLYRSTDAGANWSILPGLRTPIVNSIIINPSDPSRVYVGTQINAGDAFVMKIVQ